MLLPLVSISTRIPPTGFPIFCLGHLQRKLPERAQGRYLEWTEELPGLEHEALQPFIEVRDPGQVKQKHFRFVEGDVGTGLAQWLTFESAGFFF